MKKTVKIDYVSDIACPWCAVGLGALEQALKNIDGEFDVDIHFQPFELNPHMPEGGQDVMGFDFHPEGRKHVYNTFNAHRLLHWAEVELDAQAQYRLKRELLGTYFTLAVSLDDHNNLIDAVKRAGLDTVRAQEVLSQNLFSADVRARQQKYTGLGISSVPSLIINDQYLLQGAQPAEAFEQALRQVAAETA